MNVKVTTLGSLWQSFWIKVGRRTASSGCWWRWSSEQSIGARGQQQTQCAYWWKRRYRWVAVAESGRQTSEPPHSLRNFTWVGNPSVVSLSDYSQRSASQVGLLQEKARSTADWSARRARVIFGMQFERRYYNVITSKLKWELKHANSILESFEYFRLISSKSIHTILSSTLSNLLHFWDTV